MHHVIKARAAVGRQPLAARYHLSTAIHQARALLEELVIQQTQLGWDDREAEAS